jgi:hypothetical protein
MVNLKREEVSQIHGCIIFRSATQPRVVKSFIMMFVIQRNRTYLDCNRCVFFVSCYKISVVNLIGPFSFRTGLKSNPKYKSKKNLVSIYISKHM